MKPIRKLAWILSSWIFLLTTIASAPNALANIYATNIRINGGTTNVAASPGDAIRITFVLNEPASLGTTVQVHSGASTVTTLFFPAETQGALRGLNEIIWDGLGPTGQPIAGGTYSVAVVPATSGYTNWTQITSDTGDPYTRAYGGRGIAVDRNVSSLYFGRVLVANSSQGPDPSMTPGDTVGILRLNSDTSGAEEVISSADLDGYEWLGGDVSPWKLEVAADDYVYITDLARGGLVNRWDPTISSNSLVPVLRQDNLRAGAALSGPAITGSSTNLQLWMADTNQARVFKWSLTSTSVCAQNDTGIIVVSNAGPNLFDVAVDNAGNVYACAFITNAGDPSPRVFKYPPYDPATNGGLPQTNATWAVGNGDDTYAGASGLALDPTGTYLAVAFHGPAGAFSTNGNTKILYATNGAVAANVDLGLEIQNDANHDDTDVAWDAVGNVYYIDLYWAAWRIFSPPGTNQSTSMASAMIRLSGPPTPPSFTKAAVSGTNMVLTFSGDSSDTPSSFTVLSSPTVTGTYAKANATVTAVSPGVFQALVPMSGPAQYYRIRKP